MGTNLQYWKQKFINGNANAASLAFLRLGFGLLMFISMMRFWANGWIEKLYLEPSFHFHYAWFPFIEVPGYFTYGLFFICGLSALGFALGFKYRLSIIIFFLSFTYIELMDKTTYLNHYYFVSVLSFMFIWLPAHCRYSIDAWRGRVHRLETVPVWQLNILKCFVALVYLYAGLAKLNTDWLLNAMPMGIWMLGKTELPLIGPLLKERWVHFAMSWAGAFYDLFIVCFLLYKPTRVPAFAAVIVFHVFTWLLFPIGMFPFIMILCAMIFFSGEFHQRIMHTLFSAFETKQSENTFAGSCETGFFNKLAKPVLALLIATQLLLPVRSLLHSGDVFWHEQGFRYSWRVMLMEKAGYANFKIVNGETKQRFYVQNDDFLTSFQEKQMATQPDFILEYGKFLGEHFSSQGHENVEVYVESYVALNGRPNQPYVHPEVDLTKTDYRTLCKEHLVAFQP